MIRPLRRVAAIAVGALILGGAMYYVQGFVTAETRIRAACAAISPGSTVDAARRVAASYGLAPPLTRTGINYVVDPRTFGRYGCRVEIGDGVVQSSTYNFAG